jgi:hypothetical protein
MAQPKAKHESLQQLSCCVPSRNKPRRRLQRFHNYRVRNSLNMSDAGHGECRLTVRRSGKKYCGSTLAGTCSTGCAMLSEKSKPENQLAGTTDTYSSERVSFFQQRKDAPGIGLLAGGGRNSTVRKTNWTKRCQGLISIGKVRSCVADLHLFPPDDLSVEIPVVAEISLGIRGTRPYRFGAERHPPQSS